MHIDKYYKKRDDGLEGYFDDEGVYYDCAESFIQIGILDHCGCGAPDESLMYIRDILSLIGKKDALAKENDKLLLEAYENLKNFFHSPGEEYTMYYLLANKELTEHGGSVPGWLTLKGEELLEDLEELYREDTNE